MNVQCNTQVTYVPHTYMYMKGTTEYCTMYDVYLYTMYVSMCTGMCTHIQYMCTTAVHVYGTTCHVVSSILD